MQWIALFTVVKTRETKQLQHSLISVGGTWVCLQLNGCHWMKVINGVFWQLRIVDGIRAESYRTIYWYHRTCYSKFTNKTNLGLRTRDADNHVDLQDDECYENTDLKAAPQPLYRLTNNGLFSYRLANNNNIFLLNIEFQCIVKYRINAKYVFGEHTSMFSEDRSNYMTL